MGTPNKCHAPSFFKSCFITTDIDYIILYAAHLVPSEILVKDIDFFKNRHSTFFLTNNVNNSSAFFLQTALAQRVTELNLAKKQ